MSWSNSAVYYIQYQYSKLGLEYICYDCTIVRYNIVCSDTFDPRNCAQTGLHEDYMYDIPVNAPPEHTNKKPGRLDLPNTPPCITVLSAPVCLTDKNTRTGSLAKSVDAVE